MGFGTYVAVGNLAANQIIVIDANGNVRVLAEGELPKPGEVTVQGNPEFAEDQQLQVNLVGDNGENQDISEEIADIFAALEEGQDPTELGEDFATAAGGQSGSSLTASTSVARDGAETIASTNFETQGFESLGLSQTQSLSLLEQFALFNPVFVDLNNDPLGESLAVVTDEDTPISGTLTATDQNAQDILTFSQSSAPSNGTAVVNPDGTWTYTPDENYNGPDSFTVIVDDGNGGTDTLVVNIDVTPVNDPAIVGDDTGTVIEDSAEQSVASGTLNIVDVDEGEAFVQPFSATNEYGTFTIDAEGNWSFELNNDSKSVQSLTENDRIPLSFEVTSLDGTGSGTVEIIVQGEHDTPPKIVIDDADGSATASDNSVLEASGETVIGSINVSAQAGIDTVTIAGQDVTNASTTPVVIGQLTITGYNAATGEITYSYTENDSPEDHSNGGVIDSFEVEVTDRAGQTHSDSLDIEITDTAPTATDEAHSVTENASQAINGDAMANEGDAAIDGDASFNGWSSTTAQYGTFTANDDGTYTYVLDESNPTVNALNDNSTPLTETFTYTIVDADGSVDTATVTITINGHTDAVP
ncbi:VCBS domain-containing protein, partial [Vibrio sinaloensis]|uniref:VCBS domain-containing protein n=1 Tax=Photobacterium sp. (strain ATCC 43367) TaxID=379097 RepID=UPI0022AF921D